jgi:hypothetical protein
MSGLGQNATWCDVRNESAIASTAVVIAAEAAVHVQTRPGSKPALDQLTRPEYGYGAWRIRTRCQANVDLVRPSYHASVMPVPRG